MSTTNAPTHTINANHVTMVMDLYNDSVKAANAAADVMADENAETGWELVQVAEELGLDLTPADTDHLFDMAERYRRRLAQRATAVLVIA